MQFQSIRFFALVSLIILDAQALNPIHDASVEFIPAFLRNTDQASFVIGESFTSKSNQKLRIPVTYLHPISRDFQIGVGLQSRWYQEPNNIRNLILGLQFAPSEAWSLQADLLAGVANYAGDGIAVKGDYRLTPFKALNFLGTARLGFFDALVWHPDYLVASASFTPQIIFNDQFQIDLEMFSAIQAPGVKDFSPLIWAPVLP
jgi:hypothetical protein